MAAKKDLHPIAPHHSAQPKTPGAAPADRDLLPAPHPQPARRSADRPTPREILRLQRTIGNHLVSRQLRQLVQRALTRGSGWGAMGWTDGPAGQKLWEDIDRKFNTELPALKSKLTGLKTDNGFFASELQAAVDAIVKFERENSTPIVYSGAKALDALLNGAITKAEAVVTELGVQQVAREKQKAIEIEAAKVALDKLLAKIELLPAKVSQVKPPDFSARRELKKALEDLKAEKRAVSDEDLLALSARLVKVEKSFNDSADLALKAKQEKEAAELAQEKQQQLDEAEAARIEKLGVAIKSKVDNQYANLLRVCGDIDILNSLMPYITKGQGGVLSNALTFADPGELLKLFAVRPIPVTTVNQLLTVLGHDRADTLLALLQAITAGEEAKLLAVLTTTNGDPDDHVTDLLAKVDITTLATLLRQGDTTQLTDLLVTKNLDVAGIKTLLGSTSADDTVFMLEKVPDTKFLLELQPITASPEQFRALVSDLPLNLPSIAAIKNLLKRKNTVTTLVEINAEATVKKARGLLTAAGATIAEGTVSALAGTNEKASVQATLDGIASGTFPTLTHAAGAKFGDVWNNDQGRLPGVRGAGGYKEYYVEKDPASGSFHGERRLVVNDKTEHVYYTADHYGSFMRIQ
jgi:guanyl-specific ribonuclease Sa